MDESLNNKKTPSRRNRRRTLFLLAVCGIVAFIVLIARLYKVMIIDHDLYQGEAVEQQVRETTINASRGTIYDTNMNTLAVSATVNTIYISPVEMLKYGEDPELIAENLSSILGVDYDWVMKKWNHTDSWYETVAKKVEKDLSDQVLAFKSKYDLKSVHILEDTKRYYPYSTLASQMIGFVGGENYGLEGLESVYESTLRGVNGRIVRATTSEGTDMLYTGYESYYDAMNGNSLVLTVDTTIQYSLEKQLNQAIADYGLQGGAMGIVMDVNTGGVLAMTALPNYDLNNYLTLSEDAVQKLLEKGLTNEEYDAAYKDALLASWRNRVISDTYEPGSTFKIITLASALEEGITSENDTFNCGGSIQVKGRGSDDPVHCWNRTGHGVQTLGEAAQHSCNVAFVTLALRLGANRFYDYMRAFGFFDKTGIDLSGESSSIWWPESDFTNPYNESSLAVASFGQTFNITPIQLITAVSAVCNGGKLIEPYIVRQVLDADGNVISTHEPKVVRQVISEETSKRVCSILETVVSAKGGTGKNAYVAGYRVAGKTGTTTKTTNEAVTGEKEYVASFIGFAPADDPQIAVLVLLDNPSADCGITVSGGAMAAPVVARIMSDVLSYLGVEPVYTTAENQTSAVSLPNLTDYTVEDAKSTLAALGFDVKVFGEGERVTDQLPGALQRVNTGSTIFLYAGESKPADSVGVPDVFGMTYGQAKVSLAAQGLFIRSGGAVPSSSTIVVTGQNISAGTKVAYGTVIEVTLIDNDSTILEGTTN